MYSLLVREFFQNRIQLLGIGIMIIIASAVWPTAMFFMLFAVVLRDNLFQSESKHHVRRFLVSLPVSKSSIVYSRFIYILVETLFLILFVWAINGLVFLATKSSFPWQQVYLYTWEDILIVVSIVLIIDAIIIPLYYIVRSVIIVYVLQAVMGIGFLLLIYIAINTAKANFNGEMFFTKQLVEGVMDWLTTVIPLSPVFCMTSAFLLFLISMQGTVWIFKRLEV